jgi:hypothetical protein
MLLVVMRFVFSIGLRRGASVGKDIKVYGPCLELDSTKPTLKILKQ